MAMQPSNSNAIIDGNSTMTCQRPGFSGPAITAYPTVNSTGGAVTCNLQTDTILYRGDGGIWDDTQKCWVSVDAFEGHGTF